MPESRSVFNHVGLCVTDRARSRAFYEGLLGFRLWWELDPPDAATSELLQLAPPLGVHATYLVRDAFVLELIDYTARPATLGAERTMDQIGLTHLSFSVPNLADALAKVHELGGSVWTDTVSKQSAMVRDPDGQLLELLADSWLSILPPRPGD